jgi:hypothetical protein
MLTLLFAFTSQHALNISHLQVQKNIWPNLVHYLKGLKTKNHPKWMVYVV